MEVRVTIAALVAAMREQAGSAAAQGPLAHVLLAVCSDEAQCRAAFEAGALEVLTATLRDHVASQPLAGIAASAAALIVESYQETVDVTARVALVEACVPALRRYADDDTDFGASAFLRALRAALDADDAARASERAMGLGFAELAASLLRGRKRSLRFKTGWAFTVTYFSTCGATQRAALAAGCVPLAAQALAEHPGDANLFDAVLRVAYLLLVDKGMQLVFSTEEDTAVRALFPAFMAAVPMHKRRADLQRRAFAILRLLPPYTPSLAEAAGAAGVPAAAVAALRANVPNPGDKHILQDACMLLDHVCCCNDANARAADAAGVFPALVAVMRHAVAARNGDEADAAVCVVASMCVPGAETDCLRPWIDVAGLWRAGVVHAMADAVKVALRYRTYASTPLNVLHSFCSVVLSSLLLRKLSVEDALAAGALQACAAALTAVQPPPPGDDHRYLVALEKAFRLLDVLIDEDPVRADAALAAGALEGMEQHAVALNRFHALNALELRGITGTDLILCAFSQDPDCGRTAHARALERLRAAGARHDAGPCATPRCAVCAACRRACALPGCGVAACADGRPLKHCDRCKRAVYCTKEHQLADWAAHKRNCKVWRHN